MVFSSDNGPWLGKGKASGSAGVLRAGKFTDYEGGCRVPCIAWQPGQVAAGVVSDTQLSTMDLFPTIAQMVGGEVPSDRVIDGVNITQVLKGASKDAPEREYYLYRGTSLRMGDWKLFQDRKGAALYNLKDDVRERHDVSKENPDLVAKLKQKQSEVFAEIKANLKKKK